MTSVFRFYAFYYQLDGVKAILTGTMRGLGILQPIVHIVFVSYYVVSPPIEYLFGYVWGYEVAGLYVGQFFGEIYHSVVIYYYVYRKRDWATIVREAHERMEREKREIQGKDYEDGGSEMQNMLN